MEIINFLIILICCISTWIWALKKRFEIKTLKITFLDKERDEDYDEYERKALQRQKLIFEDSKDLEYTAGMLQEVTLILIDRIKKFGTVAILIACFFVYWIFEEKAGDIAQPIYFFIGAYSQLWLAGKIVKDYRMYDPRVIYLSRLSKWNSHDFVIKLNSYITISNQVYNFIIFTLTYFSALCKCLLKSNFSDSFRVGNL